MTIDDIMKRAEITRATVYRWMAGKGKAFLEDGVPAFPKPVNAPSKPARWDNREVEAWLARYEDKVTRWPKG